MSTSSSSKRPADSSDPSSVPPAKKAVTLAGFLNIAPLAPFKPNLVVSSPPITDRQSTFVAHATTLTTVQAATDFQTYVRRMINSQSHPSAADHEMLGYRVMIPKTGRNGLGGAQDWTVKSGGEDDGESRAKSTITQVLEAEGSIDVAVVVSRYYGGIMLGPARFNHITNVVRTAVKMLETALALPQLVNRLEELDAEIELYLPIVSSTVASAKGKGKASVNNYGEIKEPSRLERLIDAREKRLEFLVEKRDKELADIAPEEEHAGGRVEEDVEESREPKEPEMPRVPGVPEVLVDNNCVADEASADGNSDVS